MGRRTGALPFNQPHTELEVPGPAGEQAARSSRLAAILQLSLASGVGPRTYKSLIEHFGSAERAAEAAPSALRQVAGIGPKLVRAIVEARQSVDVPGLLKLCADSRVELIVEPDDAYPRMLREIHDPPSVLYVRGELRPHDALAVAIVGTRHATAYGLRQAERLSAGLARAGFAIVSGMARGIDAAAHRGALAAGGRTIAVLGCGVLEIYPPEHKGLSEEVMRQGALVSEAPPQSRPHSGMFPQRNRLITGMSLGVIVVEAAHRSGAMISAEHAMEQGRDVFAVPGSVDNRGSRGCHQLLRDGAKLVESVDDVLQELGPLVEAAPAVDGRLIRHPAELQLNPQEQAVLDTLSNEPCLIDQVIERSRLPVHRVLATLSVLEMRRLVQRLSGNRVVRR